MQYVSVYDSKGYVSDAIKKMSFWNRHPDFSLSFVELSDNQTLQEYLNVHRPDIFVLAGQDSGQGSPKEVKSLISACLGIHLIVIGDTRNYQTVREYFLNGVYDYLVWPLEEEMMEQACMRIYEDFGLHYVVDQLQLKIDALIDNIFLGGGQEEYIIQSIIGQIYEDWNHDPINCQIISDKARKHIYEILIERKPWLEKFLYRNDFTYHFGFSLMTEEEIIRHFVWCFQEASKMVMKYQMIDDKLVYRIGKYVVVHVDEPLSLEKVAKGVFLNPSYVSHIFKATTGMSFVDYMAEVKTDRAKVLLRDPKIKIYEVARTVGYQNPEYFTRIFRKKTGYAPVEYQRRLAEEAADRSRL